MVRKQHGSWDLIGFSEWSDVTEEENHIRNAREVEKTNSGHSPFALEDFIKLNYINK